MSRYRIVERDFAMYVPQVKKGFFWKNLDHQGRELSWDSIWSGPLQWAVKGVMAHQKSPDRKISGRDAQAEMLDAL